MVLKYAIISIIVAKAKTFSRDFLDEVSTFPRDFLDEVSTFPRDFLDKESTFSRDFLCLCSSQEK